MKIIPKTSLLNCNCRQKLLEASAGRGSKDEVLEGITCGIWGSSIGGEARSESRYQFPPRRRRHRQIVVFAIDARNPSPLTSSTISVAYPNAAACPQFISRRIRQPFARNVRPRRGPEPCSSQWEYGTRCKWHWHVHGYAAAFVWHTGSPAFHAGTNWTVCSTQRCHVATELESNCR